jgi:hypothetical protein
VTSDRRNALTWLYVVAAGLSLAVGALGFGHHGLPIAGVLFLAWVPVAGLAAIMALQLLARAVTLPPEEAAAERPVLIGLLVASCLASAALAMNWR